MPAKDYYPDAATKDAIDDEWAEAIFDTYDDGGRHLADMLEKHPVPKQAKEFLINLLRGNYGPLGLAVTYAEPKIKDISRRNVAICMDVMDELDHGETPQRAFWKISKRYKKLGGEKPVGERTVEDAYLENRAFCQMIRELQNKGPTKITD